MRPWTTNEATVTLEDGSQLVARTVLFARDALTIVCADGSQLQRQVLSGAQHGRIYTMATPVGEVLVRRKGGCRCRG